jgi:hypothetical protein
LYFSSRGLALFVPTYTRPPATTGLPYVCDPSFAAHASCLLLAASTSPSSVFATSTASGRFASADTMFRDPSRPHVGQSPASSGTATGAAADADAAAESRTASVRGRMGDAPLGDNNREWPRE